ncbi:MAG TPA: ATP-binding cassette domain-containing protein [Candidatus Bathyarchaeia archaeon]|nr:ATP-binding cassette domain-containing protein [Candidatus Bathyarchaeia archaeon]
MSRVLLTLQDVDKSFFSTGFRGKREKKVLRGVSFDVKRGETVALVGESGSGKSTTARLILGLDKPTKGNIWFQQKNIALSSPMDQKLWRKQMQIVFQDPIASVNPRMNILKIVGEPLVTHGFSGSQALDRVIELLGLVGMNEQDMYKYPHQLSGGQMQRIGIARAIALKPAFLILDEPTSALDVSIQARVLKLLKTLQKELELTYLFITHDLNVVQSFADRVLVMKHGEIVERGSVQDIFHSPQHVYTQTLLEANLIGYHRKNAGLQS